MEANINLLTEVKERHNRLREELVSARIGLRDLLEDLVVFEDYGLISEEDADLLINEISFTLRKMVLEFDPD